jgi:SAM-dependent methyltransferase
MRTGGSDQEDATRTDLTRYLERLAQATSEAVYDRLAGYGFARRYVGGKVVADIGWEDVGYGSQLLAGTAESVSGLTNSTEAVDLARTAHPAPNAEYRKVNLPKLPYPEDHFDVVVALGVIENLERPEELVKEARRVLKQDGVLVISVPDKLVLVEDGDRAGGRGMYVSEFRGLLEQFFGGVLVYRQGAVAGGFVFPEAGKMRGASVESAPLSASTPYIGAEPPTTRSVIAVCGGTEVLERAQPYLLLDHDRRVFDECEDRAEDVELLREEIRRMQETEVQAFYDALKLRGTEIGYLRARIRRSDAEIHALKIQKNQIQNLRTQIRDMENSTTWRIFEPYRRLRARMNARKKRPPERPEGSDGER